MIDALRKYIANHIQRLADWVRPARGGGVGEE